MRQAKKIGYPALIVLVPMLLLMACGSGQEETPAATPSGEAAPATLQPESAQVATESTAAPQPALSQVGGMAGFRDNLATADQFVLQLTGVANPPEGQIYQGWLLLDDGTAINVGDLNVRGDGAVALVWNSPDSENLLARFSRFQVTLEPAAGGDNPGGPVVMAGGSEEETSVKAHRLFVRNVDEPATPLDTAFATGLIAQTDIAVQHVQNAINAAAIGALPEMRAHLEHVINIIEGAAGPRFGDHDGNGSAENPGDGFGVLGYSEQIATLLPNRPDAIAAAIDIQSQGAAIQDLCFEILALEDIATASPRLEDLKSLNDEFKADPVTRLYQAAQAGVDFEVKAVEE